MEAAERYLEEIRRKPRSWASTRGTSGWTRTGRPLWRNLPKKWHAQAEEDLHRLVRKYWYEHGHGPSQQKHASLIGNVVQNILHCRMTHRHLSKMWRYRNALQCVDPRYHQPSPKSRVGFTPRTKAARSSQGSLAGI